MKLDKKSIWKKEIIFSLIFTYLCYSFRCGTHSAGEGYTIEQDLSKDYPECCAKLVKVEKKAKRVNHIPANEVKINKFRSRERAVEIKENKPEVKEKIVAPKSDKETKKNDTPNTESE